MNYVALWIAESLVHYFQVVEKAGVSVLQGATMMLVSFFPALHLTVTVAVLCGTAAGAIALK